MGLRNNKVEKPVEEETINTPLEEEVPEPEPQPEETAGPKVSASTTVSTVVGGDYPTLESCRRAVDLSTMQLKRIVGSNGQLQLVINKNTKIGLGEWADVNIISFSDRWMVVPVKDPSVKIDSSKFCKASFDGENVYDGLQKKLISIDEYSEQIADKFPNGTNTQKYLDLVVMVLGAAKNGDKAQDEAVLQVSISPTAVKEFEQYRVSCPIRVMQGRVPVTHQCCLRITANQQTTTEGQDYVTMSFGAIPLEVVVNYKPLYMPKA